MEWDKEPDFKITLPQDLQKETGVGRLEVWYDYDNNCTIIEEADYEGPTMEPITWKDIVPKEDIIPQYKAQLEGDKEEARKAGERARDILNKYS